MDAATTNGLFVLGGVAVGAIPGILGPVIERFDSRKDKREDRSHEERRERLATYGACLAAADQVTVLVRRSLNLSGARAVIAGAPDRKLTDEEAGALAEARQAASQAILIAEAETQDAIEKLLKALTRAMFQPDLSYGQIETAREPVIAAMQRELAKDSDS